MASAILQVPILIGLLMQAVFGAAGPTAAMCIQLPWQAVEEVSGAERDRTGSDCKSHHGCCRADQERQPYRSPIDIAPPCDAGCLHCVDVNLPDETPGFGPRHTDVDDVQTTAMHGVITGDLPWPDRPMVGLPLTTGPPVLLGCPHRDVVRTVRLLI